MIFLGLATVNRRFDEWRDTLKNNGLHIVNIERYLNSKKIRCLDLLEIIGSLGFWKLKIINLYIIIAPKIPRRLIDEIANFLDNYFYGDRANDIGCAVMIKTLKGADNSSMKNANPNME